MYKTDTTIANTPPAVLSTSKSFETAMNPVNPMKLTIEIMISMIITIGCKIKYRFNCDFYLHRPIYAELVRNTSVEDK